MLEVEVEGRNGKCVGNDPFEDQITHIPEIDEHRAEYPTDGSVQHRRAVVGEQRRLVDLRGAVERKKRTAEERAQEREEREARRRESERARRLKRELVERVERAQTTLW